MELEKKIKEQMLKSVNSGIKMGLMEAHKCLLMFLEEKKKLKAAEYITRKELDLLMEEIIKNYVSKFDIN